VKDFDVFSKHLSGKRFEENKGKCTEKIKRENKDKDRHYIQANSHNYILRNFYIDIIRNKASLKE